MEVLMAIFVLTTGLLGIAMVIPAGRALMVEASKNDRGSACGRAALNEVQIRQWYNSSQWKQKWKEGLGASVRDARVDGGLLYGETYFLDPYFFIYGANDNTDTIRHFPYVAYPDRECAFQSSYALRQWPDRALARRVAFEIPEAVAGRLTAWADELIFSVEKDGSRPRQMHTWTDGKNWASPSRAGDDSTLAATDIALRPADEGRFTWAAMITPIVPPSYYGTTTTLAGTPAVPLINPSLISKYEVSIVVFYKRLRDCPVADPDIRTPSNLDLIRERSVFARLDGGGLAGGDVLLFVPNGDASRPTNYLDVRKNDWIMLKGLDLAGQVGDGTNVRFTCPTVCKWYRVLGVDDEMDTTFPDPNNITGNPLTGRGRYVTLAGPDWNVDTISTAGPTKPDGFNWATDIAEAALIKDVVGVYTTIIDTNTL